MQKPIAPYSLIISLLLLSSTYSQVSLSHARWAIVPTDTASNPIAPRTNSTGLKEPGPCGGVSRTDSPAVLKSGATIDVKIRETIYHNGHFRIAFSPASDAGFEENILMDNIPVARDTKNGIYTQTIALPAIECDDCTLQLIQYMSDSKTNYYSCADIHLTASGTPSPPIDDAIPPANISNLMISGGDSQADISWTNPVSDFYQVLVLQDTQTITENPIDKINYQINDAIGTANVIYTGDNTFLTSTDLQNGNTYYYKIFAFDTSLNYAMGVESSITLMNLPQNMAPTVTLIAEQSQTITTTVRKDQGNVIAQLGIADTNPNDKHTVIWSSDTQLIDLDFSDTNFTFDPSGLPAGSYTINVNVIDDGNPALMGSASLDLNVIEPRSTENPTPTQSTENTMESESENSSTNTASLSFFLIQMGLVIGFSRRYFRKCVYTH